MDSHLLPKFGETRLRDLTRFKLQSHLNQLAKKYSKSAVQKAGTWLKAAGEALDQYYALSATRSLAGVGRHAQAASFASDRQQCTLSDSARQRPNLASRTLARNLKRLSADRQHCHGPSTRPPGCRSRAWSSNASCADSPQWGQLPQRRGSLSLGQTRAATASVERSKL